MRTVSFKSVYDAILQRLGLDPLGDAITYDTARTIAEHITERAQTAWQMWDWPTLTRTEERAYRQVFDFDVLYDSGDEVYYPPTELYYKVIAGMHPPVGTAPPIAMYWEVLDPVTTFVDRDQDGQLPLGQVVGVYKSDPSLNGAAPHDICLKYRPTERGIHVCYGPLATVFVCYTVLPPEYTMVPWISGKSYVPADRVFWVREVYRCLAATNTQPPSNTSFWMPEPVPDIFASYLKLGAAADCLKETFAGGEDQVRLARATGLNNDANAALYAEIDALLAQGQKHYYIKPYWSDGWCLSEPWLGSIVFPIVFTGVTDTDTPDNARITTFGDIRVTTTGDFRVQTESTTFTFSAGSQMEVNYG